jgi:hypothetical protein
MIPDVIFRPPLPTRVNCHVMTSRVAICVAAALAVVVAAPLRATVLAPAEFREIVADASRIVRGRVTDVRGVVARGDGIDTIATVTVESVVKGQASGFVSVRVPGGELGRTRWVVVGAPTFAQGDRVVLFLKRGSDNAWRPVGFSMGVFRVQVQPLTGRALVDLPVLSGQTAAVTGRVVRGDPRRKPVPVQEFESLVRLVMAAQGLPKGGVR